MIRDKSSAPTGGRAAPHQVSYPSGTSSPSKLAVSGSKDSTLRVWDTETRHCLLEKRLPGTYIWGLCEMRTPLYFQSITRTFESHIVNSTLIGMGAVTGIVPFEDSSMVCSTHAGCVMLNLVHGHRLTETKFF